MVDFLPIAKVPQSLVFDFLQEHQKFNLELAQKMILQEKGCFVVIQNAKVIAAFFLSTGGLLLHIIPVRYISRELEALFCDFFCKYSPRICPVPIYCVIGSAEGEAFLQSVLQKSLKVYPKEKRLMSLFQYRSCPCVKDIGLYKIKHCAIQDIATLFLLQQGFETEETLPKGRKFSPLACRISLKKDLQNGKIYALVINKNITSKLNIKAQTKSFVLFSGVYTPLQYRNSGYAGFLVWKMADTFLQQNKTALLFAKKQNTPALKAYTKAGFVQCAEYEMDYY